MSSRVQIGKVDFVHGRRRESHGFLQAAHVNAAELAVASHTVSSFLFIYIFLRVFGSFSCSSVLPVSVQGLRRSVSLRVSFVFD